LDPLGTAATNRPIVPTPGDYDDGEIGGMIGRGNRSTRRMSTTTLHVLCPDANPGRRGVKPATNRLRNGTAYCVLDHERLLQSQEPNITAPGGGVRFPLLEC
jgi:hypothetical protein